MTEDSTISIASGQGDYPVQFDRDISSTISAVLQNAREAFVVCDAEVLALHQSSIQPLIDRFPAFVVEANEETKSLDGVSRLINWLIEHKAVRSSEVVAIGGGCIQDLVGFTSHIYYRGVSWRFVPTTLLSQADSCIGAKTGINVLPYKNQLGAMHSPKYVGVASDFLTTLPDKEIASGYGEILKLSVTSSRHFFSKLEPILLREGMRNSHLLSLVRSSLLAKQEVIELDEYESDLRRILNYGHSFGHALEATADHQVPHGLAVMWGIDLINWLGVRWGITQADIAVRMRTVIESAFPYVLPLRPSASALIEMLRRDKKVAHGSMNFAVLVEPGEFVIDQRPINESLLELVQEYLETNYVFRSA